MAKLGSRAGWSGNYCHDLTATASITPADSGKVFFLNSTTEFTTTLPTIADAGAGFNVKFMIKAAPSGADYVITENTSSDTNVIITNGINELETDTDDDGPGNGGHTTITFVDGVAVAGDWIDVLCDGTNWYVHGQVAADGGITLA